jgi:hypothetical protein
MTTLTLRRINDDFIVTGPDIEPAKFESRREAKDWCVIKYPGSPIKEIGADGSERRSGAMPREVFDRSWHANRRELPPPHPAQDQPQLQERSSRFR